MFLTTNRNDEIDDAFESRITISYNYVPLNFEDRCKVWTNLLNAAKIHITNEYIKYLAKLQSNGRRIKNIIRLANTLAISEKTITNQTHFNKILSVLNYVPK